MTVDPTLIAAGVTALGSIAMALKERNTRQRVQAESHSKSEMAVAIAVEGLKGSAENALAIAREALAKATEAQQRESACLRKLDALHSEMKGLRADLASGRRQAS